VSTWQLVLLRLYMVTVGRFAAGARLLRSVLVRLLVTRRTERRYTASSRFFSMGELD